MSAAAWIPIITGAIEFAIRAGKQLGLSTPSDDDIREISEAANATAAKLLPFSIEALAIMAQATAAHAAIRIASIAPERCHQCGGVFRIRVDQAGRHLSCDNCDGVP